jgi:micrococcal nuclease
MRWWSSNDDDNSNNNTSYPTWKYFSISPQAEKQLQDAFSVELSSSQWMLVVGTASVASFLLGMKVRGRIIRPFYQPITSLQDLSSKELGLQRASWLRGRVVSVSDGDTIRFLHQPIPFVPHAKKSLSNDAYDKNHLLPIRLCSIDTPETAKFGRPGMAFGEQAKDYLKELCLDQTVQIKILQLDQYGRAVAQVRRPKLFFGLFYTYLDEAMLKAGLAEVYVGSGAVYGRLGSKEPYVKLMDTAKTSGRGMWADHNNNNQHRESAAVYKRRIRDQAHGQQ